MDSYYRYIEVTEGLREGGGEKNRPKQCVDAPLRLCVSKQETTNMGVWGLKQL